MQKQYAETQKLQKYCAETLKCCTKMQKCYVQMQKHYEKKAEPLRKNAEILETQQRNVETLCRKLKRCIETQKLPERYAKMQNAVQELKINVQKYRKRKKLQKC